VRHIVEFGQKIWEVDVFEGANRGLVLAEVELERADESVELPAWVGEEVSRDAQYRNAYLARHPWAARE
jgi:adenylate cyclase